MQEHNRAKVLTAARDEFTERGFRDAKIDSDRRTRRAHPGRGLLQLPRQARPVLRRAGQARRTGDPGYPPTAHDRGRRAGRLRPRLVGPAPAGHRRGAQRDPARPRPAARDPGRRTHQPAVRAAHQPRARSCSGSPWNGSPGAPRPAAPGAGRRARADHAARREPARRRRARLRRAVRPGRAPAPSSPRSTSTTSGSPRTCRTSRRPGPSTNRGTPPAGDRRATRRARPGSTATACWPCSACTGCPPSRRRCAPHRPSADVTAVLVTGDPGELAPLARLAVAELRGCLRAGVPALGLAPAAARARRHRCGRRGGGRIRGQRRDRDRGPRSRGRIVARADGYGACHAAST